MRQYIYFDIKTTANKYMPPPNAVVSFPVQTYDVKLRAHEVIMKVISIHAETHWRKGRRSNQSKTSKIENLCFNFGHESILLLLSIQTDNLIRQSIRDWKSQNACQADILKTTLCKNRVCISQNIQTYTCCFLPHLAIPVTYDPRDISKRSHIINGKRRIWPRSRRAFFSTVDFGLTRQQLRSGFCRDFYFMQQYA